MEKSGLEDIFLKAVKRALTEKGWNQKTLAEKAGISVSTVNEIINAKKFYGLPTWSKIAEAFGESLPAFLGVGKKTYSPDLLSVSESIMMGRIRAPDRI